MRKYTKKEGRAVFRELKKRARVHLSRAKHVILDATFIKAEYRAAAKRLAAEFNIEYKIVHVAALAMVVKQRITDRFRKGDVSEAEWKHYLIFKKRFEPLTEKHITVNNSGTLTETKKQVDKYF